LRLDVLLPEITTPALGAPPLLNQEGSYYQHSGEPSLLRARAVGQVDE